MPDVLILSFYFYHALHAQNHHNLFQQSISSIQCMMHSLTSILFSGSQTFVTVDDLQPSLSGKQQHILPCAEQFPCFRMLTIASEPYTSSKFSSTFESYRKWKWSLQSRDCYFSVALCPKTSFEHKIMFWIYFFCLSHNRERKCKRQPVKRTAAEWFLSLLSNPAVCARSAAFQVLVTRAPTCDISPLRTSPCWQEQ